MDRRNYENKDLVILLIGIGSIILSFFIAIFGVIAGILGLIFALKARSHHRTGMNTAAVICSLIGILLGAGSMVIMMAAYYMSV